MKCVRARCTHEGAELKRKNEGRSCKDVRAWGRHINNNKKYASQCIKLAACVYYKSSRKRLQTKLNSWHKGVCREIQAQHPS